MVASSFIIITKDRFEDLARCLESIGAQATRPDEVVIVDAGADPRVEPMARDVTARAGIALRYVRSAPGTSLQRNLAVRHASGDLIFFLDDDVILEPGYHQAHLDVYRHFEGRPIGGVQGTITNLRRTGRAAVRFRRFFLLRHPITRGKARMLPSGHSTWYRTPPGLVEVETMIGGCCSYRKAVLEEFAFDETLAGYGFKEDVDLSYRVSRRWPLYQTPHARLWHRYSSVGSPGLREFNRKRMAHTIYLWRKNVPHTPLHMAALAWSLLGLTLLAVAQCVFKQTTEPLLGALEGLFPALGRRRPLPVSGAAGAEPSDGQLLAE